MEFAIKGRREKERISEIRSKPKSADVTAKTALISPSVCTAVQNRRRPRPVSLKAAISAQTNTPERAEPIAGHPAPGTLRFGRAEPCHRLRLRTISAARAKPYAPAPFGRVRTSVGTAAPTTGGGTPALCNSQSVRLFRWRRTYSTARFASAIPAAKGRTNTPSSSFWKARFINLFAGKIPPLPFIRRYTIPVVNAA